MTKIAMVDSKGTRTQWRWNGTQELRACAAALFCGALAISSCSDEFTNCKETRTCPLPVGIGGQAGDNAGGATDPVMAGTPGTDAPGGTAGTGGVMSDGGSAGCEPPYLDCDGSRECATDPESDKDHCGDCETQCFQQCRSGVCADPIQVSVGLTHACALLSDGSVWCWGSNFWGELGPGHPDGATAPVRVSLPQEATEVQAGGVEQQQGDPLAVSCAVLKDETVRCWGAAKAGGLGNGDSNITGSSDPVEVKGVTNVSQISHSGAQGCAVTGLGKLYCWGLNADGQVGNGSKISAETPVPVLTGVSQVSCGAAHTCARTSNGDLYCWGSSASGRLGIANPPADTSSPQIVPGMNDTDEVSAAYNHTLARKGTYTYGWGHDYAGQVNASYSYVETPIRVDIEGKPPAAKRVIAGSNVSAVIGTDDLLTIWGVPFSVDGELEIGELIDASFGAGAIDNQTTCVIDVNHELSCWGADTYGQAGNGDPVAEVRTPTAITFED
jgi:alpha-tubulin suppressor-like RCC1 family protein